MTFFKMTIQSVALSLSMMVLSSCAGSIDRDALGGGPSGPGVPAPNTPGEVLPELPSFQPTTTETANPSQLSTFNQNQFVVGNSPTSGTPNNIPSYIPLGNTLAPGFLSGNSHGLELDTLIGSFGIFGNRLVSSTSPYSSIYNMSMATLSYSFPDLYMGGHVDARSNNGNYTEGAVYGRHHDVKKREIGAYHCNAKCVLTSTRLAQIRVQYGTAADVVLSSREVPAAHGIVECAMFEDNIAMYWNGVLVGLVEDNVMADPNSASRVNSVHEAYFGFQGNGASWGSFAIADLRKVRDKNRIIHYSDEFNRPSHPDLGPQWSDILRDIQVVQGAVTPANPYEPAESVLHPTHVNNVDVRAKYALLPLSQNDVAEASVIFGRKSSSDRYSARVIFSGGVYAVHIYRNGHSIRHKILPPSAQNGTLRVVVRDQYVQVYVNNQMRLAKSLPSYPLGSVGMRLHSAVMDDYSVGYP